MSITNSAVSVGTSATLLAAEGTRESLGFAVPSGGATVYVGGPSVTTANGWPVTGGTSMMMSSDAGAPFSPLFAWYGIVADSTQDVRVLVVSG